MSETLTKPRTKLPRVKPLPPVNVTQAGLSVLVDCLKKTQIAHSTIAILAGELATAAKRLPAADLRHVEAMSEDVATMTRVLGDYRDTLRRLTTETK